MAEIWDGFSPIASPAATDRVTFGTGPLAGGYSLRGDLVWKNAAGFYTANGAIRGISGTAGAPAYGFTSDDNSGMFLPAGDVLGFSTAGTERARITSGGFFGIGTTSPAARLSVVETAAGTRLIAAFENAAASDAWVNIKGGDRTGQIRVFSSTYATPALQNMTVLTGDTNQPVALLSNGGFVSLFAGAFGTERLRVESGGAVRPGVDNSQTLGAASARWSVVYAGTGTINTSDADEKTWRGPATSAELAAAKRIIAEVGFFQWNDAIAEKGEAAARLHFGVRAQAVWAIMADEGLIDAIEEGVDPDCKYAFLCWDKWEANDDRPVGARFGIREGQLDTFLIAAQQAMIDAHEARLTALEAAA